MRERQKVKRRDQILDAARRLIRATGGTDFPMRRLADEAEVGLVTPYNQFGSKGGVLYALLNDSLERLDRAIDVRPSAKPVDAVLFLAGTAADMYAGDPAFYRPLMQHLLGVRDPQHRPRSVEYSLRLWSRAVDAAVRGGLLSRAVDADLLARQLMVTFIGVLELWIHGDLDDDALRAQCQYGSALLLLAHATPSARPRLWERVRAIERRLPRALGVARTRKKKRARAA